MNAESEAFARPTSDIVVYHCPTHMLAFQAETEARLARSDARLKAALDEQAAAWPLTFHELMT